MTCPERRRRVRTGATDDVPLHWPCDALRIADIAWTGSARDIAARLGVSRRTVHRWRTYVRRTT